MGDAERRREGGSACLAGGVGIAGKDQAEDGLLELGDVQPAARSEAIALDATRERAHVAMCGVKRRRFSFCA